MIIAFRQWAVIVPAALMSSLIAGAQAFPDQELDEARDQTLQIDVDYVLVNATVTDRNNRPLTGLSSEHFLVFEDRVEQSIESFSSEDVPLSVGIIFDVSGSMRQKLDVAREAVGTFLRTLTPSDEHLLVEFNNSTRITQTFTTDISSLQNRLVFTPAGGMTALFDAVYRGLEAVARDATNPKKALLLITDGQDNASRYNFGNLRDAVRESDVQIYAIGIVDAFNSGLGLGQSGRAILRDIAEETGGLAFFPNSVYELEDIATRISIELKNQYVLGYISTNRETDGDWRNIQVRLDPPRGLPSGLTVRAKRGYYAPVQ
jgi:Ca-activated chloride channel family protein